MSARNPSPSQGVASEGMPRSFSAPFTPPKSPSSRNDHSTPTETDTIAHGTSTTLRRKPRPKKRAFSSSANTAPSTVVPTIDSAAK